MKKYLIAGGRDFNDKARLYRECERVIGKNAENVMIVTGGQKTYNKETKTYYGADYFGEQFANDNGYWLKVFNAKWDDFGKAAGPIRNKEMAVFAEGENLIAFWDGKSKGTGGMIELAKKHNMKIEIISY